MRTPTRHSFFITLISSATLMFPEPVSASRGATPIPLIRTRPPEPAVPETVWQAMHDREVELVMKDEKVVVGKIVAQDAKSVTVIEPSREVTVLSKATVTALRVAAVEADVPTSSSPPPLPSSSSSSPPPVPATARTAIADSGCAGLDCVLGPAVARVDPVEQVDPAANRDRRMRSAGLWTMVAGASGFGIGVIMLGAAVGAAKAASKNECLIGDPACDDPQFAKLADADRTALAGIVFAAVGGVTTVVGGAVFGVANARVKRRPSTLSLSPSLRGVGFAVQGRF